MTRETLEVCSDKRKPREERQNHRYHRYHGYPLPCCRAHARSTPPLHSDLNPHPACMITVLLKWDTSQDARICSTPKGRPPD